MLIKKIDLDDMIAAFDSLGRGDTFSLDALRSIIDYYDELDENFELDVVELCGNFTEYTSLDDYNTSSGTDYASIDEVDFPFIAYEDGFLAIN